MKSSIFFLVLLTMIVVSLLMLNFMFLMSKLNLYSLSAGLFPTMMNPLIMFFSFFSVLGLSNLVSMVCYSYPVTTTLAFNLGAAFSLWLLSIFLLLNKKFSSSALLPSNSPWYLVPFLSLVEMVSILVRPLTLCFRLLANMSAGHILLSLICKLPYNTWMIGVAFGVLELMVALVQSFVFLMLVSVYLEEGLTH